MPDTDWSALNAAEATNHTGKSATRQARTPTTCRHHVSASFGRFFAGVFESPSDGRAHGDVDGRHTTSSSTRVRANAIVEIPAVITKMMIVIAAARP